MSRPGHLWALFGVVAWSACDVDPQKAPPLFRLEGSLGQVMDVGYDEARVLIAPEDITVQFVRIRRITTTVDGGDTMSGTTENYPVNVSYRLWGAEVPGKGTFDLAEVNAMDIQRGVLSRNVSDDPRSTFPKLTRGTLTLNGPLTPGSVVTAEFRATFENGIDAASGRTVFSNGFSAKVQP
jgi:hypothetical protein